MRIYTSYFVCVHVHVAVSFDEEKKAELHLVPNSPD